MKSEKNPVNPVNNLRSIGVSEEERDKRSESIFKEAATLVQKVDYYGKAQKRAK